MLWQGSRSTGSVYLDQFKILQECTVGPILNNDDCHKFAESISMSGIPANPFTPGIGERPPYMGVRPHADTILNGALTVLQKPKTAQARPRFIYLYGPRGNGKTVLLTDFEKRVQDAGIRTVVLVPANMQSADALIGAVVQRLCERDTSFQTLIKDLSIQAELNFGPVRGSIGKGDRNHIDELMMVLKAANRPLLITLDEAHTEAVDPIVLGTLMDAVQTVGRTHRSTVLTLVGTPGLEDKIQDTGASYWDRGHLLPIGRLSVDAATHVISKPLDQADVEVDPISVERLVQAADQYPYFLQLYGSAAFDAAVTNGCMRFGSEECDAAIAAAQKPRRRYYMQRLREFEKAGKLELARAIALAFRTHGNRLTDSQLRDVLNEMNPVHMLEHKAFLRRRGYVWDADTPAVHEPGIPSLMDFMIEQTESLQPLPVSMSQPDGDK